MRTLNLGAGRTRQTFPGVSASIRPETVGITGRGLSVVEQNFDYDLLTPDALMQSAVGREIQLVRTNPGTGAEETVRATVLAANQGVVLRIGDRVEVLRDDGVPTRVIFDEVPENLRPRPTLSVTLDAEGAGARETTLSYLTTGLQWKADYVARFDEQAGRLDLNGWITVTNNSGSSFEHATTRVVAGDVTLVNQGYNPGRVVRPPQPTRGNRGDGTEAGGPEGLADVYVYPLPEPVTVANKQTKQVGMMDVSGVRASKRYRAEIPWFQTYEQPRAADVAVVFSNNRAAGLGRALPAGVMRVYVRDEAGEPRFIGENAIDHTPGGSEIAVTTGQAFDVTVQPRLVSEEGLTPARPWRWGRTRYTVEYTVRNARSEAVTVELRQRGLSRETRFVEAGGGELLDSRTLGWSVRVPANGETVVRAVVDTGY